MACSVAFAINGYSLKIAYGDASIVPPERENSTHQAALAAFRAEVGQRHPNLRVETMLMALDGSFISLG